MSAEQSQLPSKPLVVRSGDAPAYSLTPSDRYQFFFSGHPGQPEMFDGVGARGDGTPLHRHPWASWEVVLDGQVRFVIDGNEYVLGPGDFAYTPPGAAHAYVVESETARIIGFNHPSGRFEELQKKAGPLFQAEGGPDLEAIARLAAEHEVEILGPPLAPAPAP